MKLVYGISRWTNPSRPGARHIDNGKGKPLCGGNRRKVFTWETEEGTPTCDKCIAIDAMTLHQDRLDNTINNLMEFKPK